MLAWSVLGENPEFNDEIAVRFELEHKLAIIASSGPARYPLILVDGTGLMSSTDEHIRRDKPGTAIRGVGCVFCQAARGNGYCRIRIARVVWLDEKISVSAAFRKLLGVLEIVEIQLCACMQRVFKRAPVESGMRRGRL